MQIAIVGLAGVADHRLNTLTRGPPDGRLRRGHAQRRRRQVARPAARRLAEIFKPKKVVQADVRTRTCPRRRVVRRTSRHRGAAGRSPRALRDSDALLHVVRASRPGQPTPAGSVDPARDLEQLDLEFTLADLAMAERRLERLGAVAVTAPSLSEKPRARGVVLRRIHEGLEAGSIRTSSSIPMRPRHPRFRFLTEKPVLVLLNVGEGELASAPRSSSGSLAPTSTGTRWSMRSRTDRDGARRTGARRGRAFMESRYRGVAPWSGHRAVYGLLGLVSFLTADPTGPCLADPGRSTSTRRVPSTPISRRASSGPRPWPTRTAQARLDGGGEEGRPPALRGRTIGSRTGRLEICSAADPAMAPATRRLHRGAVSWAATRVEVQLGEMVRSRSARRRLVSSVIITSSRSSSSASRSAMSCPLPAWTRDRARSGRRR